MAYKDYVLRDGPVSYWRLEENTGSVATDEQGNNNGTWVNESDITPNVAGLVKSGSAYQFGSGQGRIDVGSPLSLTASDEWSMEIWVSTSVDGRNNYIMGTDLNYGAYMRVKGLSDLDVLLIKIDDGGSAAFGQGTIAINDGEAHHCVMVKEGGRLKGYVDSILDIDIDASGVGDLVESLFIGTLLEGSVFNTNEFEGILDEPAVYQYALTPDQIADHYDVGANGVPYLVAGTVTADGSPAEVLVRLYHYADGSLIAEATSDPADGAYTINGLRSSDDVLVVTLPDGASGLRPLAHGPITPQEETI